MTFEEWVDCRTFHFLMCQALHNGGYTRFLSMFLDRESIMTYREFYITLFESLINEPDSFVGKMIRRISDLVRHYRYYDELQQPMITNQLDLVLDLCEYSRPDPRYWHVFEWPWILINTNMELFYDEIKAFLRKTRRLAPGRFSWRIRASALTKRALVHGDSESFTLKRRRRAGLNKSAGDAAVDESPPRGRARRRRGLE
jgi:hypothetical protein